MLIPYPIRSSHDPLRVARANRDSQVKIDYDMTSPLIDSAVNNFPCKGWQNDQTIWTTATYTAGETYSMAINNGAATHTGGSCQLSLSYDNGATFKVIKSMMGGCPLQLSYNFTIPSFAPSGTALFAWTWFNKVGNRYAY